MPPFYFPILQQEAAKAELEGIRLVMKESENVLEKVEKQKKNVDDELTERARDVYEKEFKIAELKLMPCYLEKDVRLKCYKENINDTIM
ncbi:hypothetical protein Bca4012_023353 [Brassica carinata]